MDRQALIGELTGIIGEYLKVQGLELVDIVYRYEGRDLFLRILLDRPEGGITLDECSRINIEVGSLLDAKDIIPGRYILEVSSPGTDRPLKTKSDFLRCVNRKVRFFLAQPVNGKIEWEGSVTKVDNDSVDIATNLGTLEIPLSKINKAKQII